MANYTLKLDTKALLDHVMGQAESGVSTFLEEVAADARTRTPKSKRKVGQPVSIVHLRRFSGTYDLPTTIPFHELPMNFRERANTYRAYDIGTREPSTGPQFHFEMVGITAGAKKGSEIFYPFTSIRWANPAQGSDQGEGPSKASGLARDLPPGRDVKHKLHNPVTGPHLKESIRVSVYRTSLTTVEGMIVADRPYAWYVDQGTQKMTGKFYLSGAFESRQADLVEGKIIR